VTEFADLEFAISMTASPLRLHVALLVHITPGV
jgi:hypothetical protein